MKREKPDLLLVRSSFQDLCSLRSWDGEPFLDNGSAGDESGFRPAIRIEEIADTHDLVSISLFFFDSFH